MGCAVALSLMAGSGAASAQGSCARYEQMINSPPRATGALEAMVEVINKIEANLSAIDQDCEFATRGLSPQEQANYVRQLQNSLSVAKSNCRQLSAGGGAEC